MMKNMFVQEAENKLRDNYTTCSICRKEMLLRDGDVLFDAKWYHKDCYKSTSLIADANMSLAY